MPAVSERTAAKRRIAKLLMDASRYHSACGEYQARGDVIGLKRNEARLLRAFDEIRSLCTPHRINRPRDVPKEGIDAAGQEAMTAPLDEAAANDRRLSRAEVQGG